MSQIYGTPIQWSTGSAANPAGGICENYDEDDKYDESDHDGNAGDLHALVAENPRTDISFTTSLTDTSKIPILNTNGGCKVTITGRTTGLVLFSEIAEEWNKSARTMTARCTHFPDAGTGGSAVATTEEDPDEQTTLPLIVPGGKLFWGTNGVASGLGIVQRLRIIQRVVLDTESEEGKIKTIIASKYQLFYELDVIAKAAQNPPAKGTALVLSTAPARFQATNVITNVTRRFRKRAGVLYSVRARWAPSFSA